MKYDLVIAGGGTAGCACAYTASKLGLKTLLIEKNSFLGGSMTSALVTPAMNTKTNSKINTDFFELLMKNLHDIGGQITYCDGNIGWFNPELMKIVLDKMMAEVGVTVLFNSEISQIIQKDEIIQRVILNNYRNNDKYNESICNNNINGDISTLSLYIEPKYVVDATGDAKIFEKLNLKFLNFYEKKLESEKIKNTQPVNLRFIMSGINIKEFADWITAIDKNRDVTTVYETDRQIHLSTAYTWDKDKNWALEPIFKQGITEKLIEPTDSNYFQVFSIAGMPTSLAFNCPRILKNIEYSDVKEMSIALKEGREAILRLSNFFKSKFKGFENAYISSIANSLGIRVSNRIEGQYIYTIDDLKSGKKFDNPVLISKYPIDVHSVKQNDSILSNPNCEYMLPVESLISADYKNLFAIGRCISADFYAQAALRIIPSCCSMGEGLAKYLIKAD